MITDSSQSTVPPESRGGLLADKMGLGKSLTMISLIALNPTQRKEPVIFTSQGTIRRAKSTLIIVPYSCRSYSGIDIVENSTDVI
jgi:SWI/SNF-related matrix-associated actin-dependent regulator of chromatin subfamily A3